MRAVQEAEKGQTLRTDGVLKRIFAMDPMNSEEKQPGAWLRHGNPPGNLRNVRKCGAQTRRGTPCGGPAVRGRRRCRLHGGWSTGPRTPEGLNRSRRANWKHGARSVEAKVQRWDARFQALVEYERGVLSDPERAFLHEHLMTKDPVIARRCRELLQKQIAFYRSRPKMSRTLTSRPSGLDSRQKPTRKRRVSARQKKRLRGDSERIRGATT